jgi:hypothetical protein
MSVNEVLRTPAIATACAVPEGLGLIAGVVARGAADPDEGVRRCRRFSRDRGAACCGPWPSAWRWLPAQRRAANKVQALAAITQCQSVIANALKTVKAAGGGYVRGWGDTGLTAIAGVLARAARLIQTKG